jgi:hypothetical protein
MPVVVVVVVVVGVASTRFSGSVVPITGSGSVSLCDE